MKISFDYDGTLSEAQMQRLAKRFIESGHEVWITTSRALRGRLMELHNVDVFELAKNLGIKRQIQFTNYEEKYKFLEDFDIHFDDSKAEVNLINASNCGCTGLLYESVNVPKHL